MNRERRNSQKIVVERKNWMDVVRPDCCVDVVLDTDIYNEIDDQYALAYLMRSPENVRLQAVYAAPFVLEGRSSSPSEGMERSYQEAEWTLDLIKDSFSKRCGRPLVYHGVGSFLQYEFHAVYSEAAGNLTYLH